MAKIVSAGVILKETILSVPHIPIQYSRISFLPNKIFCGVGGHAFNMSLAMQYLGDEVTLFSMIGEKINLRKESTYGDTLKLPITMLLRYLILILKKEIIK